MTINKSSPLNNKFIKDFKSDIDWSKIKLIPLEEIERWHRYHKTISNKKESISSTQSKGCICKRCNLKNEFAEPNQEDGSYLCYNCRL